MNSPDESLNYRAEWQGDKRAEWRRGEPKRNQLDLTAGAKRELSRGVSEVASEER